MQMDINSSSTDNDRQCSDTDEYIDQIDQSIESISHGFNRKLQLECDVDSMTKLLPDAEIHENEEEIDDDDEDDVDDDDEFTFMLVGEDESSTSDDKVLENGQIRPVFPLFDRNLLFDVEEIDRLPMKPPVDKVFIQSPGGFPPSTASERDENHDATIGPYCDWSKRSSTTTATATANSTATGTAELSKKSNSTGFSKLWRLKEKIHRSNSDGRDAFVFLRSSDRTTTVTTAKTTASSPSSSAAVAGDGSFVKVNVAGGKSKLVKQATKAKKSKVSAHEAYLKSRGHTVEERRRSYLPYRPELMGFFTNVHGGLTKNVHPY